MSKIIYTVFGSTGEYSDRSEWPVAAYENIEQARNHVEAATRRAKEIFITSTTHDYKGVNVYDPNMQMDYTGTHYYISEFKMFNDITEFMLAHNTNDVKTHVV